MKKSFCKVLCVLCALVLLTGCGGQTAGGELNSDTTTQPQTQTVEGSQPVGDKEAVQSATSVATDPTETTTATQVTGNPISLGTINDGVYKNTYVGIGCMLDGAWQLYGAGELQSLPENTQDMFSAGQLETTLNSYYQITDMLAENATEMISVNVLYTRLSAGDQKYYAGTSDEALVDDLLQNQRQTLVESYANAGYEITVMEKKTVTFLGQQRTALYMEGTTQGTSVYWLQLFDYTLGHYGVTITFMSFGENKTESVLSSFYKA